MGRAGPGACRTDGEREPTLAGKDARQSRSPAPDPIEGHRALRRVAPGGGWGPRRVGGMTLAPDAAPLRGPLPFRGRAVRFGAGAPPVFFPAHGPPGGG